MQFLIAGFVAAPHGVFGKIKVRSASGEFEHFKKMQKILLRNAESEKFYDLQSVEIADRFLILKLFGVENLCDAEKLRGAEILVSREFACPCEKNEWYIEDLKNCVLFLNDEQKNNATCNFFQDGGVALVCDVLEGGGGFLLEVLRADQKKVLIPLNDFFIGDVDVERKKIELRHAWILENL